MTDTAVTRSDIANAISNKMGLSVNDCQNLVENVLEGVCQGLEAEGQAKLVGFGTFDVREKKARIGRNPKTKVEAVITPRKVVSFRVSSNLKNVMNNNVKKDA